MRVACVVIRDIVVALVLIVALVHTASVQRSGGHAGSSAEPNLHLLSCPQIFEETSTENNIEITLDRKAQHELLQLVKDSRQRSDVVHTNKRLPTDYNFEQEMDSNKGLDLNVPANVDNERFCKFLQSVIDVEPADEEDVEEESALSVSVTIVKLNKPTQSRFVRGVRLVENSLSKVSHLVRIAHLQMRNDMANLSSTQAQNIDEAIVTAIA